MKHIIFFLGIILYCPQLFSQDHNFIRSFGGAIYDDARSMVATDDGCFVFTGLNKSDQDPSGDMYLMKVNAVGGVIWKKFYGRPLEDGGNSLIKCADGGFLIAGHVELGEEICEGYIVKVTANGEKEWDLLIGDIKDDVASGVVEWSDGSFFVTGKYENPSTGLLDVLISKISSDGKLEFIKKIERAEHQVGHYIIKSTDDNLLISGYTQHSTTYDKDLLILKINSNGAVIWEYTIHLPDHERAWGLVATEDGGCVFTGGATGQTYKNGFVGALNSKGELVKFDKLLENIGESYTFDIAKTAMGYVVCGVLKTTGSLFGCPLMISLNDNLDVNGYQTIPTKSESEAKSFVKMKNGDYLLAGKSSFGNNHSSILLARARLNFNNLDIDFEKEGETAFLFPNPFLSFTYLKIPQYNGKKTLSILNNAGQIVRKEEFDSSEILIYRENMAPGLYYYSVVGEDGQQLGFGKLIAQ